MDNWNAFVDGLIEDDAPIATRQKGEYERRKFKCDACAGTGLWQGGRVNRNGKRQCFACNGQGYFVTSKAERLKAREYRIAKKQRDREAAIEAFDEAEPGLREFLKGAASWSQFAADLLNSIPKRGLSAKRVAAARSMQAKCAARQQARKAEREAAKVEVDLSPIREMFEAAVGNGHKRPTYRAEGIVINRAPDSGRNPGALYVKNEGGEYGGKVIKTVFSPSREGRGDEFCEHGNAGAALAIIAENPLEAAIRYGRKTGRCACCGRELTNKVSIELGIGPICREKWNL